MSVDALVDRTRAPYAYAGDSPLNSVDPDGLSDDPVADYEAGALDPWDSWVLAVDPVGQILESYQSRVDSGVGVPNALIDTFDPVYSILEGFSNATTDIQDGCPIDRIANDFVEGIGGVAGTAGIAFGGVRGYGALRSTTEEEAPDVAPTNGNSTDWAQTSGIVRDAAAGKGNFGLGSGTIAQADEASSSWVGPNPRLASDGKTFVSADGLRQFRPPMFKSRLGIWQANLESRSVPSGEWQNNGHLEITDEK
jgi:hypothetical protein